MWNIKIISGKCPYIGFDIRGWTCSYKKKDQKNYNICLKNNCPIKC